MSTREYDVVILGGGTGGYLAAIRAAQAGKSTAIVEKDKLGGTCLHRGCIPSKSLLRSAEVFATAKQGEHFGIRIESMSLDFTRIMRRKEEVVEQLHQGVQSLMRQNKIDIYYGKGRVIGPSIFSPRSGAVAIENADDEAEAPTLLAKHTIIATGSRPRVLEGFEPDGRFVMTSDEALAMEKLPASVIIVGGGVIGMEWASMLNDFGLDVTVVEAGERIIPHEDEDVSRELSRLMRKRGVTIHDDAQIDTSTIRKSEGEGISFRIESRGKPFDLQAEMCLVSVGRSANIEEIGLENTDVAIENGRIVVNEYKQTSEPHIYAIGDIVDGLQLAHKAGHDALIAVDHLCGKPVHPATMQQIPRCIYTRPEAASVGMTEREAIERGYDIKIGKVPFQAIGKALVYGESDGFVKVVADAKTEDVLGVHMIGPHVTDYISVAGLAQVLDATPWEIGAVVHPHPTLSEALAEAMIAVDRKMR